MDDKFKEIEELIIEKIDIYSEIVSYFECSKCGECCQKSPNLLFSDECIKFDKEIIYYEDGLYGIKGDPCPFFIDNKCKIHDSIKPRLCRFAPFIIGNGIGQIVLKDCELGKNITKRYNIFLKESNIDILNIANPFNNIEIMKSFLDWLT